MLRSVAVLALDQVAPFELGVLAEVFGTDRTADGFPGYRFQVCSPDGAPVRTSSGFHLTPHADLGPVDEADLVAVPAHSQGTTTVPGPVLDALRRADARGAYLFSVCSGAFLLGEAGLLDDRECTTHWRHVDELQARHPRARVRCNSLYVQDGRLLTSAGTAAGIDACLHLIRQEHGSATATRLARRMVVPPHRDGGQSQYVEAPIPKAPEAPTLEPVLEWLMGHLDRTITVEELAARAGMAPRTFARRFRAETGTTPHDWLTNQRVLLARRLLEETPLSVEAVADQAGFGDAAALRHHFSRRVGATPHSYRTTFRDRAHSG
ncbi:MULTISPECIES: helix-turn-helix domain-containing protein [unclassified Micromonospora]|uniref:GlxA family transcriptional regulator n=1 Tax=unclassified Micromonospora TaxID=2617518 RepID=UPI00249AE335|nr:MULTISPECIES: helix-turn-helix domain-containing protein [unclassified Micromonospora]WFE51373.1 helix-turn-helix domain-containing protein [Micromonospora sp. WMMD1155]WFF01901.1 helix-turn-helix domain-containing protein [Micromonospora sp. WMMD964]